MQTETLGQIIDRLIIAQLKYFCYDGDGKKEAADLAGEQVTDLSVALDLYDWECRTGKRVPQIQRHLRYHDHNDTEAWRAGKKATGTMPETLAGCVSALALVHCEYWATQSRIQGLKKCIDGTSDPREKAHFEHELVVSQRRGIDLSNQRRNELIQHLDTIYQKALDKRQGKEEIRRLMKEFMDEQGYVGSLVSEVHHVRVDGQGPVDVIIDGV